MNPRGNVMVFIDGGYIRKYTKEKYETDLLHYDRLGRNLAVTVVGINPNLIRIYYYDAIANMKDAEKVNNETEKEFVKEKIKALIQEQENYFETINTQEFVTIRQGHLVVANKESPRQKGVDIFMSIDMLTGAFERQYDWAVLIAGDSDFLPLVEAVKHTGCNIMGVYWKNHVSKELVNSFDRRYELDGLAFKENGFI